MNRKFIEPIVARVAADCFVSPEEILLPSGVPGARLKSVAYARRWAMAICRRELNWSTVEIGRAFGRDHTTVMLALKRAHREHPDLAPVSQRLRVACG
jgi:chromosomal replication initiation ATPase DnaA